METVYNITITFDESKETFDAISEILGVNPVVKSIDNKLNAEFSSWTYEVIEGPKDPYFDFINVFLDLLENKFEDLQKIGVEKEDITFWLYYEYDQQCNLEFDSKRIKRLGDSEIGLCISCWQGGK